jgi:hypothetical protein
MICGPFVTVSPFVSEDNHRVMPGRLDNVGWCHYDSTCAGAFMGTSEGDAKIEVHVRTQPADIRLVSGADDLDPALVGPIVLRRRQNGDLCERGSGVRHQGHNGQGSAHN